MSVLYIKVLSDYYHHIIGDLEENRKNFLVTFYNYLLEKDEYGYAPIFDGELERVDYLLKQISLEAKGMNLDEFLKLMSWYDEDAWANGEIFEYFLHHKKEKEIKLITDIHSLNKKELQFIKDLDNFLNNKGKILKFFNVHNGKYQNLKEIL